MPNLLQNWRSCVEFWMFICEIIFKHRILNAWFLTAYTQVHITIFNLLFFYWSWYLFYLPYTDGLKPHLVFLKWFHLRRIDLLDPILPQFKVTGMTHMNKHCWIEYKGIYSVCFIYMFSTTFRVQRSTWVLFCIFDYKEYYIWYACFFKFFGKGTSFLLCLWSI